LTRLEQSGAEDDQRRAGQAEHEQVDRDGGRVVEVVGVERVLVGQLVGRPGVADLAEAGLADELRTGAAVRRGTRPAVVGRVEDGRLLLDLRAVSPADDELLGAAVAAVAG